MSKLVTMPPIVGETKIIRSGVSTDDSSNPAVGSGQDFSGYTKIEIEPTFEEVTKDLTNIVDYSATVAGTIKITLAGHELATGDTIAITGTTNYNGSYSITKIDADNFYVTATYVADETSGTVALTTPVTTISWDVTMLLLKSDETDYKPAVTTTITDDTPFELDVNGNSDVNAKLDNSTNAWRSIILKAFGINK